MSKFACKCGYVIGFNRVPCRYDGEVIRDTGDEAVYDGATNQVANFIAAIQRGHRDEWLRRFYGERYYRDLLSQGNDSVVDDILIRHISPFALGIHQCERCGRLWLQRGPDENAWVSYLPEGDWRGALETPAKGFVGYVADQDFFGMYIEGMHQEEDTARVTLIGNESKSTEVTFTGVTAIRVHDGSTDRPVRFLSEWIDAMPLRRFLFDSNFQNSEPLLEVTAQEVRL